MGSFGAPETRRHRTKDPVLPAAPHLGVGPLHFCRNNFPLWRVSTGHALRTPRQSPMHTLVGGQQLAACVYSRRSSRAASASCFSSPVAAAAASPAVSEERYAARGVSAGKEDVHAAIASLDKGLFKNAFCKARRGRRRARVRGAHPSRRLCPTCWRATRNGAP